MMRFLPRYLSHFHNKLTPCVAVCTTAWEKMKSSKHRMGYFKREFLVAHGLFYLPQKNLSTKACTVSNVKWDLYLSVGTE